MFKTELRLPAQAAAETEATIISWNVSEGSSFKKGDVLAEVESAKSSFSFEAPCDGAVSRIYYGPGETVSYEDPVIEIETEDESAREEAAPAIAAEEDIMTAAPAPEVTKSSIQPGNDVFLLAVGGYLPERRVKTSELLNGFPDVTEDYIIGVTGIKERRWANQDQKPSDLALAAAYDALDKAGMKADALDGIVVTTTTPDVVMPSTACILQEKLGVRGIPAFDLNAACSGWLYGITVAKGLVQTGIGRNILVVGVDMHSQLLDKTDKGTYFLFGDGAGATIVSVDSAGRRLHQELLLADSKGLRMARREMPGYAVADSEDALVDPWVRLDGYALFRFATESFSTSISTVIEKSGWSPKQVRWVIPHQANGRILKAAAKKSGVAFERWFLNIDHVGNTSSASIPLAILEIERGLQKGDKLILCSVGAGITAAAISLEW